MNQVRRLLMGAPPPRPCRPPGSCLPRCRPRMIPHEPCAGGSSTTTTPPWPTPRAGRTGTSTRGPGGRPGAGRGSCWPWWPCSRTARMLETWIWQPLHRISLSWPAWGDQCTSTWRSYPTFHPGIHTTVPERIFSKDYIPIALRCPPRDLDGPRWPARTLRARLRHPPRLLRNRRPSSPPLARSLGTRAFNY